MADDQYDHAIDYLMRHPEEITRAWSLQELHVAGCLFRILHDRSCTRGMECQHGCLTQVRATHYRRGPTPSLEAEIRADTRIPMWPDAIRLHHLPVFAAWQRRIDRELG